MDTPSAGDADGWPQSAPAADPQRERSQSKASRRANANGWGPDSTPKDAPYATSNYAPKYVKSNHRFQDNADQGGAWHTGWKSHVDGENSYGNASSRRNQVFPKSAAAMQQPVEVVPAKDDFEDVDVVVDEDEAAWGRPPPRKPSLARADESADPRFSRRSGSQSSAHFSNQKTWEDPFVPSRGKSSSSYTSEYPASLPMRDVSPAPSRSASVVNYQSKFQGGFADGSDGCESTRWGPQQQQQQQQRSSYGSPHREPSVQRDQAPRAPPPQQPKESPNFVRLETQVMAPGPREPTGWSDDETDPNFAATALSVPAYTPVSDAEVLGYKPSRVKGWNATSADPANNNSSSTANQDRSWDDSAMSHRPSRDESAAWGSLTAAIDKETSSWAVGKDIEPTEDEQLQEEPSSESKKHPYMDEESIWGATTEKKPAPSGSTATWVSTVATMQQEEDDAQDDDEWGVAPKETDDDLEEDLLDQQLDEVAWGSGFKTSSVVDLEETSEIRGTVATTAASNDHPLEDTALERNSSSKTNTEVKVFAMEEAVITDEQPMEVTPHRSTTATTTATATAISTTETAASLEEEVKTRVEDSGCGSSEDKSHLDTTEDDDVWGASSSPAEDEMETALGVESLTLKESLSTSELSLVELEGALAMEKTAVTKTTTTTLTSLESTIVQNQEDGVTVVPRYVCAGSHVAHCPSPITISVVIIPYRRSRAISSSFSTSSPSACSLSTMADVLRKLNGVDRGNLLFKVNVQVPGGSTASTDLLLSVYQVCFILLSIKQ